MEKMDANALHRLNSAVCFALGVPINLFLYWLIMKKTTAALKMYSWILLQTCFTDLLNLVLYVLVGVVKFLDSISYSTHFI